MSESDLEVIARLAATVDRYDEGVKDALATARLTAARASRDSVCMEHTADPLEPPGGYAHRAVCRLTTAEVAAHVASRGRKAAKVGDPVYVDIMGGRVQVGTVADVPGADEWWRVGADFSVFLRYDWPRPFTPSLMCLSPGCTLDHAHKGSHKVCCRVDRKGVKIPPHAAITDTSRGRMATWYEPNRGAK